MESFVLFHLGSDAQLQVVSDEVGLSVEIRHLRVKRFRLELSWERVRALAGDDDLLEDFLLDQLTTYRR